METWFIRVCLVEPLLEIVLEWSVYATRAWIHSVPPTDSIVSCDRKYDWMRCSRSNKKLTKGDAVGPSRIANSSSVNGSLGMIIVRNGMSSEMTIGNPMAAGDVVVSRKSLGEKTNK